MRGRRSTRNWLGLRILPLVLLVLQSTNFVLVRAADDDYYNENFDDDNAAQNADGAQNGDDEVNDDQAGDDGAAAGDDYNKKQNDDGWEDERQYGRTDDDTFHWNANVGFDGVSVMPVSCVNYNGGHMIKYQLYDTAQSYQCHFAEISTFVVSIAHYMRAYFNYQALVQGQDFELPEDAAFLNCNKVQLNEQEGMYMYAKIGCMERATFTSTKLQLHLYVDAQCSQPYDDGRTSREHSSKGYMVGDDQEVSSAVSFRVPFYSCETCSPDEVSATFNKRNSNWYDDDYISINGEKYGGGGGNGGDNDDGDDGYMASNDDINYDDAKFDDDQVNVNYDNYNGGNRDLLESMSQRTLVAKPHSKAVEAYENEFWREQNEIREQRELYDNYYDVGEWNMCQRIYKYGIWCDADCRALDFFRTDQWSSSDIFLLSIMCTFLSGMMLLIVAKRLKAQQKARMYGDDQPLPGLPPFGMAIIFAVTMGVIVVLSKLKFVNETLVFAVVTCILLFVYMLKLTLFENRRPVLLAAPRHDMFDNPLDDHLFD